MFLFSESSCVSIAYVSLSVFANIRADRKYVETCARVGSTVIHYFLATCFCSFKDMTFGFSQSFGYRWTSFFLTAV